MASELRFIAGLPKIRMLFVSTIILIFVLSLVEIVSVLPIGLLVKYYMQLPFSHFEQQLVGVVIKEVRLDNLALLAICALTISAVSGFLALYAHSRLIWTATHRISFALFEKNLLGADPYARNYDEAVLRKNIATEAQQYAFYGIGSLANLIGRSLASIIVLLGIFLFSSTWLLLVLTFLMLLFTVLMFLISRRIKVIGVKRELFASEIFRNLDQVASSLPMILGMQRQAYFESRFFTSSDSFRRAANSFMVLPQIPKIAIDFIIFMSIVGLVYYLSAIDTIPDDTMLYPLLALVKFVPGFNILFKSISERQYSLKSYQIIKGALGLPNVLTRGNGEMFSTDYVNIKVAWLDAVSGVEEKKITIPRITRGDIFVVCGDSGAGKSTILQSLSGISHRSFLRASILNPEGSLLTVANSRMAYLPQKIALINGDLARNVVFGKFHDSDTLSDEEISRIKEALCRVGLTHLTADLHTPIFNLANSFSGGEIQRVGLARIIYDDPEIIFLDEPTSALDLENESLVVDLLKQFSREKKLILLATHSSALRDIATKTLFIGGTSGEITFAQTK